MAINLLYDWSGSSLKSWWEFQNNSRAAAAAGKELYVFFFCSLFFILSPWLFFVEVILAVRVIWIDVSTFECIFESICRAGHSIPSAPHQQSSRARIPGVPKIGVQNLLLHTAKVSYDGGNGLRFYSCACPSKRGKLLTRFTFHPFFKKEWMMALLTCYLLARYPGLNLEKV